MSKRSVAIFRGNDSGGVCPCTTLPAPLSPPVGTVYGEKIAIMANSRTLTPANGNTCTSPPSPCVSPRVVKAINKVYVNKLSVAVIGDTLNDATRITIPVGSASIFA